MRLYQQDQTWKACLPVASDAVGLSKPASDGWAVELEDSVVNGQIEKCLLNSKSLLTKCDEFMSSCELRKDTRCKGFVGYQVYQISTSSGRWTSQTKSVQRYGPRHSYKGKQFRCKGIYKRYSTRVPSDSPLSECSSSDPCASCDLDHHLPVLVSSYLPQEE